MTCKSQKTSGKYCSISFKYRGVTYNSCPSANHNRARCSLHPVYKGRWGNCRECPQKTTSGKCCSIPFEYKGVTYNSCTSADWHRPWCSLDPVYKGRWGECRAICPQKTTSGKCCSIPFEYKGVTYNSCTSADWHRPWCSLDPVYKGRWGECLTTTSPTICPQKTTSGKCCSIPFEYKGVTYNSCTSADWHRPWCSLDPEYKGRWGECRECPQKTTSGKCCSIPFEYKGVTYNSCTSADWHRPWCSLDPVYKGRWGECRAICPQKTTSGKCCSIPFEYKGVTYNSCTSADWHRPWCSLDPVYKGRWGECREF
ncbi:uncharacterized protein [Porites lutea]|uniref:uncharacterized protein n=1 Tax=Porites lutea TaxID=51062 RepID=UPI003CC590C1